MMGKKHQRNDQLQHPVVFLLSTELSYKEESESVGTQQTTTGRKGKSVQYLRLELMIVTMVVVEESRMYNH